MESIQPPPRIPPYNWRDMGMSRDEADRTFFVEPRILQLIAEQAYKAYRSPPPANTVDYVFHLRWWTPNLVFYQWNESEVIVVGVRGTANVNDVMNWYKIPFNSFKESDRLMVDVKDLQMFQSIYPRQKFYYWGVGHSLGGAVVDELVKRGLVDRGRTYNSAVASEDWSKGYDELRTTRVYDKKDPLYYLQNQMLEKDDRNFVLRDNTAAERERKTWEDYLLKQNLGRTVWDDVLGLPTLAGHKLEQYRGGSAHIAASGDWASYDRGGNVMTASSHRRIL
jgi:hypothetical protein